MRRGSIWATLGIEQTTDPRAVRRAYARALKLVHPEDDPEGFQALREAYEAAMRWCERAPAFLEAWAPPQAEDDPAPADRLPPGDLEAELRARPEPPPRPKPTVLPRGDLERDPIRAPEPPPAPAPDEMAAAAAAHARACSALHRLAARGEASEAELRTALDAVTGSPAMEQVAIHERTEHWLAQLVIQTAPGADTLIEPLIAHFRWDRSQPIGGVNPGQPVLDRREDVEFLYLLGRPLHPQNRAFRALTRKPTGRQWLINRTRTGLDKQVMQLLNTVRHERRGAADKLDPGAVAWWEAWLSKPRFGPLAVWVTLAAPVLLGPLLIGMGLGGVAGIAELPTILKLVLAYLAAVALGGALLAARVYVFVWPRYLWNQHRGWRAGTWERLGWAAGAPLVILLAAVLPASIWSTLAAAALGGALIYWTITTSQIDRRPGVGETWFTTRWMNLYVVAILATQFLWRPGMRFAWQVRALFSFAYLYLFWSLVHDRLGPMQTQLGVAILAGAAAYVLGGLTLEQAWRQAGGKLQKQVLWALGGSVAVALALLWACVDGEVMRPVAVGLTAILVLAHKAPASSLGEKPGLWRDLTMRYGWIGWLAVFGSVGLTVQTAGVYPMAGTWVLTGVAVTVAMLLYDAYLSKPKVRRRAGELA